MIKKFKVTADGRDFFVKFFEENACRFIKICFLKLSLYDLNN